MRTKFSLLLSLGVLIAVPFTLAACGGDESSSGSAGTASIKNDYPPLTAPPDGAKKGGNLDVLAASDVDYIDPGAAYYQFTYMVDSATQRGLVHWAPADVKKPTPDIATADPEVSSDGKTITYKLQSGVKFSPPVNRDVKCDDFKYAIERALLPGVANGYVGTYLADVTGLTEAQKGAKNAKTAPDVPGITCPDDQTLVIKLDKPSSLGVIGALSLPIGSPVPREYAKPFDAVNPSTYGTHQVATGPYMVEADKSGKLTGYTSGKEIKLVRNPNWDASTDDRPAYLDTVDIQEGFTDTVSASKKILQGSDEVNGDFSVPGESLKEAAQASKGQLTLTPSGGNRYIALNTQKPPFDNINVRKAVVAGSNRTDLRNTRGGELAGPVATHYIPPNFPGFEQAGGVAGPDLDFIKNPNGDAKLAASYMKKAGFKSGKCEGSDCEITMIGDDSPPGSNTAEVFKDQLTQLGFKVNFQKVAHDVMYTKFCNVPKNEPNVCPNVGWLKDFQDGQALLIVPFAGSSITTSNNSNWPLLKDPKIDAAMKKATLETDPAARDEAWGKVDDMVTASAAAVPWVWDNQANIQSDDVAGVINQFNANWDLAYTSLK